MTTFRKVRELLLTSFDDGDISEDEFLLLNDVNRSKKPDFPYQNYEHFNLERLDEKMSYRIHWTSIQCRNKSTIS